jgi:hypothetical protein
MQGKGVTRFTSPKVTAPPLYVALAPARRLVQMSAVDRRPAQPWAINGRPVSAWLVAGRRRARQRPFGLDRWVGIGIF